MVVATFTCLHISTLFSQVSPMNIVDMVSSYVHTYIRKSAVANAAPRERNTTNSYTVQY